MANFLDSNTGDLVTWMKTKSTITSLVGTDTVELGNQCRLYADNAKQGVSLPYIVFIQAGGEAYHHHGGVNSIRETVLHFYCYGATDTVANTLVEAVKTELDALQRVTIGSTWVEMTLTDIPDSGNDLEPASDKRRYWRRIVTNIVHA